MADGNYDIEALYRSNVQYLTAVCSRYVVDSDDVKDVLQESFIKIFSSIYKFKHYDGGSLRAWMRRIVINESLMYLRSKSRSGTIPFQEGTIDVEDEIEPEVDDIPPEVLQQLIKQLPTGYRTVFNLRVFEEKSHREIATLLGISENTSFSQFCRAKTILAKQIKDYKNGK